MYLQFCEKNGGKLAEIMSPNEDEKIKLCLTLQTGKEKYDPNYQKRCWSMMAHAESQIDIDHKELVHPLYFNRIFETVNRTHDLSRKPRKEETISDRTCCVNHRLSPSMKNFEIWPGKLCGEENLALCRKGLFANKLIRK